MKFDTELDTFLITSEDLTKTKNYAISYLRITAATLYYKLDMCLKIGYGRQNLKH